MRNQFMMAVVFVSCFFLIGFSPDHPSLQDRENESISALVLLGEWFGDAYFPLKEEIDRRGWTMKRIGVDIEYRGCYNKKRDVVLRSDILIPDLEDFSGFDCLIIPSGPQWRKFNENPQVLQFVREAHTAGLLIASFCVGNLTVKAAGLVDFPRGPDLFPAEVTKVKEHILLGPRGGGPPPGDGFESAPVKEICDAIARELKNQKGGESFSALKGAYLGQKPPGKIAEIFAPRIVSTKKFQEFSGSFTPDGKEYYFFRFADGAGMMVCKLLNEGWTAPKPASFNTEYIDNEPHITPDGKIMYFNSNRPFPGSEGERRATQIWFMERLGDGWGEPKHLCEGMFVTSSKNGNIYLNSGITRLENGKFAPFQEIVGALNTPPDGWKRGHHSSIASDESYLIYDTQKSGSEWDSDENLFICFRKKDGSWSKSMDLGSKLNLPGSKMLATISPDNKYLFFCNRGDIYWVSLKIIEELKPNELK